MRSKLRVAVVQFSPAVCLLVSHITLSLNFHTKIGQVEANVKKATEMCSKLEPDSVDLVCLPEMIFTGYTFPNADAITPYLEKPREGPTSQFCSLLARRLRCYVVAGYPEVLNPYEQGLREDGSPMVGANSSVIYDKHGEFVGGYRKSHLFETDRTWAKRGDGFKSWKLTGLPIGLQNLSMGICMDLNPQTTSWSSKDGPYELADYCRSTEGKDRTDVLVLLNAWLDSKENTESDWDLQTLYYWVARLRPLWLVEDGRVSPKDRGEAKETIVVICNRSGVDNDTLFAGSSVVLRLREGTGDYEIVGLLRRDDECVRVFAV